MVLDELITLQNRFLWNVDGLVTCGMLILSLHVVLNLEVVISEY